MLLSPLCAYYLPCFFYRGDVAAWAPGLAGRFVLEGLNRQGRPDLVASVLDKWVALVQRSGIFEHYNPFTGEAYGAVGLGMSTLIVDWLYRTGRA